jgi:hypothetical protein
MKFVTRFAVKCVLALTVSALVGSVVPAHAAAALKPIVGHPATLWITKMPHLSSDGELIKTESALAEVLTMEECMRSADQVNDMHLPHVIAVCTTEDRLRVTIEHADK